jgi:hypothetical protein
MRISAGVANETSAFGRDNITVITVTISPNPIQFIALRLAAFWRKKWRALLWLVLWLLFGAACFAGVYFYHAWELAAGG